MRYVYATEKFITRTGAGAGFYLGAFRHNWPLACFILLVIALIEIWRLERVLLRIETKQTARGREI